MGMLSPMLTLHPLVARPPDTDFTGRYPGAQNETLGALGVREIP